MGDKAVRVLRHPLISRWLGEAGLMVIVAVAVDLKIHTAVEPDARVPGLGAYVFGVLLAALLPARRRWPLAVLFASGGLLLCYHLLNNPGISPALPLAVPLYSAAVMGRLWWAVGAAVTGSSMALLFTVGQDHLPLSVALSQRVPETAMLAALILLGETVRSRRALARQMRRVARRSALERERESERRVTEERLRIARELHDVLAHTLAGAAIQAGVAADTLADDPDTSRAAMEKVRASYREARTELAATLGVLRAGPVAAVREPYGHAPTPGLAQLDAPLGTARDAGLTVDLLLDGRPRPLSPAVDVIAYRIIQESLTNVVRHAAARSVVVSLAYGPAEVIVSITDDGKGDPRDDGRSARPDGYGLIGMHERTAAIGGHIVAGPRPEGGYQVIATLPAAVEIGVAG